MAQSVAIRSVVLAVVILYINTYVQSALLGPIDNDNINDQEVNMILNNHLDTSKNEISKDDTDIVHVTRRIPVLKRVSMADYENTPKKDNNPATTTHSRQIYFRQAPAPPAAPAPAPAAAAGAANGTGSPTIIVRKSHWSRLLPWLLMPFLLSSTFLPMALMGLKLMLLKGLFVGKLALALIALATLWKSNSQQGGVYSHNFHLPPSYPDHKSYVEHYGYNGDEEYGAYMPKRSSDKYYK